MSRLAANIPFIRHNLVPPDIFRLLYRRALSEVVTAIDRNDEATTQTAVQGR